MRKSTRVTAIAAVCLCFLRSARAADDLALYHERHRPQFHFSPAKGWMNDPNGLVFFEGEYHLFFQHRSDVLHQTPVMSWGHAVSTDLLHWTELPVALAPDDRDGWIWSGSAVVDWKNTSGFGKDGKPPLVAMYTAAKDPFAQAIAYSNDRGRTWTKFAGNPVIAHIAGKNRDPKVIWHEASKRWVVALYKDVADTFCLFASPDLTSWTQLQDLHLPGCSECPDFFPLPLDGDPARTRWVFTGANGKYLVGDFDGRTFTPQGSVRQVDFGRNFYAVQTFSDIPARDGRRIQIAWMMGGQYPRMPFNQQMSFPAELTLRTTADGPRLFRYPVREIETLRGRAQRVADRPVAGEVALDELAGELLDIEAEFEVRDASEVGLTIRGQTIAYDASSKQLGALGEAPLELSDGRLKLRILIDRTSMETFANDGRVGLTSCFLPGPGATQPPKIFAKGGAARLHSLVSYELKSAWE